MIIKVLLSTDKVEIFCEGHKNLKKISHFILTLLSNFKVMWEMFSNFVAFPQYPNFTILWVSRPEPRDLQVTHIMCLCTTRSKTSWIRNRLYIYVILEGIKNKTLNLHLRKRFECYFKKMYGPHYVLDWYATQMVYSHFIQLPRSVQ